MYQVILILLSDAELRISNSPLEKYSLTSKATTVPSPSLNNSTSYGTLFQTEVVKRWSDRLSHSQSHLCVSAWTFKYHTVLLKNAGTGKPQAKLRISLHLFFFLQKPVYLLFTETPQDAINFYRLFGILQVQELVKICVRLMRVTENSWSLLKDQKIPTRN